MRAPRYLPGLVLAALLANTGATGAEQPAAPAPDVLEPASAGGLEAVDLALAKLTSHRRLMVVGAHPDDEDNALLTWVGRGLAGEAAYLSLSRGEGGQNLIGTELGVELGIVRTGELLAARRSEGTRQYFARAYDFGYTRSIDETLGRWPREVLLEDAMRAVRRFKPQVIVAVFPGEARAGHGQHQASGLVAREAFAAARDGRPFPGLATEGLAPWVPSALYQRAWSGEQATVRFDLGTLDPLTGRTLGQIASASRSSHRSQDMGREQRIGSLLGGAVWEAGAGEGGADLFAGIDTRLAAIAAPIAEPARRRAVADALERVSALAAATRRELTPGGLDRAVAPLAEIVGELGRAIESLSGLAAPPTVALDLLREKRDIAERGLMAAAGIVVDATADRERAVPGEKLAVRAELWVAGPTPVEARGVYLYRRPADEPLPLAPTGVAEGTGVSGWQGSVEIAATAGPTVPYYLRSPRRGDLYDWSRVDAGERGEPRSLPPLGVRFELSVAGVAVSVDREVVYRYGDQAAGEVRRPLRIVPPLEIEVEPGLVLWNRATSDGEVVQVTLRANARRPLSGSLRWRRPSGWDLDGPPPEPRFSLDGAGKERTIELELAVPPGVESGAHRLAIEALLDDGGVVSLAVPTLEYPHLTPTPAPREARVDLSIFELELPALRRLGYIVGASDRVPAVLAALGLPLEVLAAADLARGDLSAYDAIVVGSRAYETDPALAAANGRLLAYVRAGGTLIVQYQQYQYVRGGYAPFALSIGRPHGRVTDETAAVAMLRPEHPVFHRPNRIGDDDWRGWVQERGLYFADRWDAAFEPLLELADPGHDAERGALLVAALGDGVYAYTGLSFFRQLPAGVPGALRLFANLLALGSES